MKAAGGRDLLGSPRKITAKPKVIEVLGETPLISLEKHLAGLAEFVSKDSQRALRGKRRGQART